LKFKSLDGLWYFKTSSKVKILHFSASEVILFFKDSPSRESKSLDERWNFKTSTEVKALRLFHFRGHPIFQRLPLQRVQELRQPLELQNLA
jgi:hypothetical protein